MDEAWGYNREPQTGESIRGRSRGRGRGRSGRRSRGGSEGHHRRSTHTEAAFRPYPEGIYEAGSDGLLTSFNQSSRTNIAQSQKSGRDREYRRRPWTPHTQGISGKIHPRDETSSSYGKSLGYRGRRTSCMPEGADAQLVNTTHEDTRKSRASPNKRFGVQLKDWAFSDIEPDDLVLEVFGRKNDIRNFLKDNNWQNTNMMMDFLKVIGCVCMSCKKSSVIEVLRYLIEESNITTILSQFLSFLQIGSIYLPHESVGHVVQNICLITRSILERFQSDEYLVSSNMVIVSLEAFLNSPRCYGMKDPDIIQEIQTLKEIIKTIQKQLNPQEETATESKKVIRRRYVEGTSPPDDFRSLSVLPCLKDLHFNERPFLRVNKVNGGYDDLDHYLDVQFRLLREDYVQPLRKGIFEYRKEIEQGVMSKKYQDIRLYEDVQIVRPLCTKRGIDHEIQFSTEKFKKVNWSISKRFLPGSLLCLSNDDFETIVFATVTNRDPKRLEDGFLEVKFQRDENMILHLDPAERFVMAETTAYFEAYRHILKGLQEIDSSFPLQRYIVECKSTMKPPKYLLGGVKHFDFNPLLSKGEHTPSPVLNTQRWPSAEMMGLDDSQYAALQLAVTKELALIQGPPGTGKTFVGLKTVQLLLHNKDTWTTNRNMDPILVVCYTNHALDQFLTEMLNFTEDIVRIGGRCNSEELSQYKLSSRRNFIRGQKQLSSTVFKRKSECLKEMNSLKVVIQRVSYKLKSTKRGLLSFGALESFIDEKHLRSLKSTCSESEHVDLILKWLGLGDICMDDNKSSVAVGDDLGRVTENKVIMSESEVRRVNDVWSLKLAERVLLYRIWLVAYQEELRTQLSKLLEICNDFKQSNSVESLRQLQIRELDVDQIKIALDFSQRTILDERTLSSTIQRDFPVQFSSLLLKSPRPVSIQEGNMSVVERWLCMDGSDECKEVAMEHILGEELITISSEDLMEGNRFEIDDDDYERLEQTDNAKDDWTDVSVTVESSESLHKLIDSNGWKMARTKKQMKKRINDVINYRGKKISSADAWKIRNLWGIPITERVPLYHFWVAKYQLGLQREISKIEERFTAVSECYKEALDSEDIEVMSGAKVIGMTTTGAAKYRKILQSIKPKIIIVEEAAEVLESHIVTAINSNCQHLILIGDHKQLRPTPTVYQLAVHYNLEISLFERMIKNDVNFATLKIQHRMRPEISKVIKMIYPELQDHSSVREYPDVPGIEHNIFFINHDSPELSHDETKSHSNQHEATFLPKLCKYIMQQGYKPSQITILATYTGQVFAVRKHMPKSQFEGIRITSVDNFQGEENDIILLSLVRSNKQGNIGFLKTENRICVALSRARHGLYVIGNFDILESQSELWRNIVACLKETDSCGNYVTLRCQNHPDITTLVSKETDFFSVPEGGCNRLCDTTLQCGHACQQRCHTLDRDHQIYKCLKPCEKKLCPLDHICRKKCFQKCGPCQEIVTKIIPNCGHENKVPCHKDPGTLKCRAICNGELPCGHLCKGKCGDCLEFKRHQGVCKEICDAILPCGHTVKTECNRTKEDHVCSARCEATLVCGHRCKGTCGDCQRGKLHIPCQAVCGQILICGHKCNQTCSDGCPPCMKKCIQKCHHRLCTRLCKEECNPCDNKCSMKCKHDSCSKMCQDLCNRKPCGAQCDAPLQCGHKCYGLCGETCPSVCQICNKDDVLQVWGNVDGVTLVTMEECNHVFELSFLDDYMSSDGDIDDTSTAIGRKGCPICSKPIVMNNRYSNILKTTSADLEIVKAKVNDHWEDKPSFKRKKTLREWIQMAKVDMRHIHAKLETNELSEETLNQMTNQIRILSKVGTIAERVNSLKNTNNKTELHRTLQTLIKWTHECRVLRKNKGRQELRSKQRTTFSKQELSDVKKELIRVEYLHRCFRVMDALEQTNHNKNDLFKQIEKTVSDLQRFGLTNAVQKNFLETVEVMNTHLGMDCFDIEEITDLSLVPQKKMARLGNWHKCNNGHISYVDEDRSEKCPECDLVIQQSTTKKEIPIPLFITKKKLMPETRKEDDGTSSSNYELKDISKGVLKKTQDVRVTRRSTSHTPLNKTGRQDIGGEKGKTHQGLQTISRCLNGHELDSGIKELPDKCASCDSALFTSHIIQTATPNQKKEKDFGCVISGVSNFDGKTPSTTRSEEPILERLVPLPVFQNRSAVRNIDTKKGKYLPKSTDKSDTVSERRAENYEIPKKEGIADDPEVLDYINI